MDQSPIKNIQSPKDDLSHQPEFVLLALARNQSASLEYRKAAVEHLLEKGYVREASHPDLELLVAQVKKEKEAKNEVQSIVESAIEAPFETPVMRAGFTTQSMYKDDNVE